ncbi:DNA cytosine methyltransferase, partial [Listeria seeligeri]|uniref:DNA cytosine methyltransferase n=1 Tax=Listeria seeligeri TaxID=1640 RepID=UPI001629FA23
HNPLGTITSGGNKFGLAATILVKNPANQAKHVSAFLMKYYGSDTGQSLDEPIHPIVGKDRFSLVTIKGENYCITDIQMRMLQSKELYPAQGFPKNYIFDRDINGEYITKKQQIAKCGNAVVPQLAKALVEANLPDRCSGAKMSVQDSFPLRDLIPQ